MNLKKYFMDLFKTLTGNVLLIGIKDQDLVEFINHKEEIKCCYLLNSEFKGKKKKVGWGLRKTPTISARNLRKKEWILLCVILKIWSLILKRLLKIVFIFVEERFIFLEKFEKWRI